jgi:DNA-directed RNA polymerase specialized sigma subunit
MMSKIDKMILQMAQDLGDRYGQEVETVEWIATELQISVHEVFKVFEDLLNPAD